MKKCFENIKSLYELLLKYRQDKEDTENLK